MKNILVLLFCLCIIFSSIGFAENKTQRENKATVAESQVQNSFPNILRPIGNWLKGFFGKKQKPIREETAFVKNLVLNRTEVYLKCSTIDKSCSKVEVLTEAQNEENDVLTYYYTISGGKIIGNGNKVIWDLSGEKPGLYTIIARVDDSSCAQCSKTITKEVKVIECSDCK